MSAVPASIDALVAAFEAMVAANPGLKARVTDGPPTEETGSSVIAVGIGAQNALDVDAPHADAGLVAVRETFVVPCMCRTWSGDNSTKVQRDRTYAVVDRAHDLIRSDPTLGGVVSRARWAGSMYMPHRTDRGQIVVDVLFRVEVTQL